MNGSMDYGSFIATIERRAGIQGDEAERVACATLRTLAERLSPGETDDLAQRLPAEARRCLQPEQLPPAPFHADEFLRRVSERAGIDRTAAARDTRAVFIALVDAVGPKEFHDMRAQLPQDFEPLVADADAHAPPVPPSTESARPGLTLDEFLARVAQRAGLDREGARSAAEAVLEVLGLRISYAQADDLKRRLPPELADALARAQDELRDARPRPLTLEIFLQEVARREGVPTGTAGEHARAVLPTLREAAGEDEWQDTTAQLPGDYHRLWARK